MWEWLIPHDGFPCHERRLSLSAIGRIWHLKCVWFPLILPHRCWHGLGFLSTSFPSCSFSLCPPTSHNSWLKQLSPGSPALNKTWHISKVLSFLFQNVLELALYDKDVVTQDDHLFTVYFDIAKLSLGEEVFMHFKCDSQVRSRIRN